MTGYASSREFGSSVSSVTGYPMPQSATRPSPQAGYGFQQPPGGPSVPSYYVHGQTAPPVRGIESGSRQSQVTTPGSTFGYQANAMAAGL